ncbi:hypothetical protein [Alterinioella nitratireducens]|uniref:hypothetical protein n=1 Tax=Alterinioella nitratireducens TaxID=2735915 RepID=UPI00155357F4|nr:hypothetical protein [Alterinioella nitratireducens]NPD20779.1 hypothetical protein [Alterinioella nitratireducens]
MPSRPFDPQWTTDAPALSAFLDTLCADLTAARPKPLKSDAQPRFEASIKAIVLDLFRAHESDPSLEVGIASGATAITKKSKSRYGASFLSYRTFTAAMDALEDAGLIVMSTPHWDDPAKKNSRVARYMATPSLMAGIDRAGASVVDLRRHPNAEGIRLKDSKKRLVEYGDNAFANVARDQLRIINDMLESHWADLALTDVQLAQELKRIDGTRDDEAAQSFDFAARTVYRVFNNDEWEQGGRFYGAWWISIPSHLRRHILIDGKKTVEVDYSGIHPAMLFALAGKDIPTDPYARCVTNKGNEDERRLVKKTFNALLNADSVKEMKKIEKYEETLTGRNWTDFKRFIVDSYPECADHFGTGFGLRLQRMDSDLAETVMLRFAGMGYACLPVHDSFIVHHDMRDVLEDTMKAVFKDMFGVENKVEFDMGEGENVEPSEDPIAPDIAGLLEPDGYEGRLQAFRASREPL